MISNTYFGDVKRTISSPPAYTTKLLCLAMDRKSFIAVIASDADSDA